MTSRQRAAVAAAVVLALAAATACEAQGFPFSQRGSVSQMVAFTEITAIYSRPVARDRVLFGELVPWDTIWHPGADSATRISFSHAVQLEGHELAAGEYSLWLIPRDTAPWTVILSRATHVYHRPYPGQGADALRFDVPSDSASHMETLAIYFPLVLRDEAVMRVHWGTRFIAMHIKAPFRPGVIPNGR